MAEQSVESGIAFFLVDYNDANHGNSKLFLFCFLACALRSGTLTRIFIHVADGYFATAQLPRRDCNGSPEGLKRKARLPLKMAEEPALLTKNKY
ncbi:MAG TPA: hypothetical protein VF273_02460 [Pelobium sp.]